MSRVKISCHNDKNHLAKRPFLSIAARTLSIFGDRSTELIGYLDEKTEWWRVAQV
ncbi:MAG: hypothetical protein K2X77_17835 [Candidatus Obscuribacterales bacterium]|nr:hypothetical protein [Candidatus Obscuribacterales bacterium]